MIRPDVENIVSSFITKWAPFFEQIPALKLNVDWPSVGVLDLMTFSLRGRSDFIDSEEEILTGSAALIAALAHECWSGFCDEVEVRNGGQGVEIVARGGKFLPEGHSFTAKIEDEVRKRISEPTPKLAVTNEFSRDVVADGNWLSLSMIGLMVGLPSFGDGSWLGENPKSFEEPIVRSVKVLSSGCADFYQKTFPKEQLGQVAELYLHDLVCPPTMLGEPLPAYRSVSGIIKFAKEYGVDQDTLLLLSHNLALSPDERISLSGLAVYGALCAGEPAPEIMAITEREDDFIGLLRSSMLLVRKELGLGGDWLEREEFQEEDKKRFYIERKLGFLPWVRLDSSAVKIPSHRELILALSNFDLDRAVFLCDQIIADDPKLIDVRFQRVYLEIINQNYEPAEKLLRAILTEPGSNDHPLVFSDLGMCSWISGSTEDALKYFEQAFNGRQRTEFPVELANNYAWILLQAKQFDRALEVANEGLRHSPQVGSLMLHKAFSLVMLEREAEARVVEGAILRLAPTDRRVFANALSHQLS